MSDHIRPDTDESIQYRNRKMALEYAAGGITFAKLGERYRLHTSRVDQIIKHIWSRYGVSYPSREALGLYIQRDRERLHFVAGTPCHFYWDELIWNRPCPSD